MRECSSLLIAGFLAAVFWCGLETSSAQPSSEDVSGSWQLSWTSKDHVARRAVADFHENGTTITGSLSVNGHSLALQGNIHGPQIEFVAQNFFRRVAFTGVVAGNNMAGKTDEGVRWSASRNT